MLFRSQPLRFDPFWYRKKVELTGVAVSGSNSGEPVVYVAGPLLDLREGMDIQFTMKSMKFYNNTGAVLLEKVGSDGIVYHLDNLLFSENHLPGSDATMGVLHLDVARNSNPSQVKLGNLAFNRNISGDKTVGLSVSGGNGTGTEKFAVESVYAVDKSVVYDNHVNSRVPSFDVAKISGLDQYGQEKDFVVSAVHNFGKVKMNVIGNPHVVKLEDSMGRPVFNNASRLGDTLILSYLEGNPTIVTLANGQKFMVPKLTAAELPPPIYRKVDTTLISPKWPDTTKTGEGDGGAGVQGEHAEDQRCRNDREHRCESENDEGCRHHGIGGVLVIVLCEPREQRDEARGEKTADQKFVDRIRRVVRTVECIGERRLPDDDAEDDDPQQSGQTGHRGADGDDHRVLEHSQIVKAWSKRGPTIRITSPFIVPMPRSGGLPTRLSDLWAIALNPCNRSVTG